MGQKVNPIGFRLPVRRDWRSCWYASKADYGKWVKEDHAIRSFLQKKLRYSSVQDVLIERAGLRLRVTILSGRVGVIIGRKGQELEKLKAELSALLKKDVLLEIKEVKKPDLAAQLVAENIALQLERRVSFRRALKKAVQLAMSMGACGIRVQCAGRLGGAEIARTESQFVGSVPSHTLRANVDYGFNEARTVYGTIGVKCWVCLEKAEA